MSKANGRQALRTAKSMHPVPQKDVTGCAIVSVATLAGVSYTQARTTATQLGIRITDPDCGPIPPLYANSSGIVAHPQEQPFHSWKRLPPTALLAIKWHRKGKQDFWHWVVFRREPDRDVVMDPKFSLKKHVRTDFGRIKPKWFISISLP